MAKHLARIHGTEEDKVNCPFYFKIGACRHADRCSRLHHKPAFSPTLLIQHIYRHPQAATANNNSTDGTNNNNNNNNNNQPNQSTMSLEQQQEDFLCFFEDMYMELSKFGKIDGLHVVDNLGDHMIGHVYVKYYDEEDAADALTVLNGRYYDGRPMVVEYSPVTDFREARCRDYDEEVCSRGGYCNFLHVKPVPMPLIRSLEDDAEDDRRRHNNMMNNSNNKNDRDRNEKSSRSKGTTSSSNSNKRKRDKKGSSSSSDRSKRNRRSGSHSDGSDGNNNNNNDSDDGRKDN